MLKFCIGIEGRASPDLLGGEAPYLYKIQAARHKIHVPKARKPIYDRVNTQYLNQSSGLHGENGIKP